MDKEEIINKIKQEKKELKESTERQELFLEGYLKKVNHIKFLEKLLNNQ